VSANVAGVPFVPALLGRPRKGMARYAQAFGKVKAMENSLLGPGSLQRMAELPDTRAIWIFLNDTVYGRWFKETGERDLDLIMGSELRSTFDEVGKILPSRDVIELFTLEHDVINLRHLIKHHLENPRSKSSGTSQSESRRPGSSSSGPSSGNAEMMPDLDPLGSVGPKKMQALMELEMPENAQELPPDLAELAREVFKTYQDTRDPSSVDTELDRGLFEELWKRSDNLQSPFVERWLALRVDMANIRVLLRPRSRELDQEVLERIIQDRGTIAQKKFLELAGTSLEKRIIMVEKTHLGPALIKGLKHLGETGDMGPLENDMTDAIFSHARQASLFPLGVEPVLGFLAGKVNEARLVRLVITGKANGLSAEELKGYLRGDHV